MLRRLIETVPPGRSLFVCAVLVAAPAWSALNLEGMTGYWMVPTAEVIPFNSLEVSVNRHDFNHRAGMNWMAGMGILPHVEVAARFAMPMSGIGGDLSISPKLGYTFFEDGWHPTSVGIGSQDVWGGARLMHANYAVLTQDLAWVQFTLGYGDGLSYAKVLKARHRVKRLGGVFGGARLCLPLPDSLPLQAALIHDYDATTQRTGGRISLRCGGATTNISLVRDWSERQWEYSGGVSWALPPARGMLERDSLRWFRLRVGPWVQSFLGTEVGRFDLQAAVEATGIVQPVPCLAGYARLRDRLWYSENFADRKAFAAFRQEPRLWLEGAGVGWTPSNRLEQGLWLQAGVLDGSWSGGSVETSWKSGGEGLAIGLLGGYWYSPEWHGERGVWMPWVDWESSDRSWFARLDAGRYWNRDEGFRGRLGRRFGRVAPSTGLAFTDDTWQFDVRMEFELDGLGWRPTRRFSLEPPPVWGHGYMTTVALRQGDANSLRPNLGKEPPLPLRGRYATWP